MRPEVNERPESGPRRSHGLFCEVIVSRFVGSRIENGKCAVRLCSDLQEIAGIRPLQVGDELWAGVMFRAGFFGKMQLPQLNSRPRCRFYDLQSGRTPTLFRSVVHDGDCGHERVDQSGAAALKVSVMRGDVDINPAETIDWAHQRALLVGGKIAQIENSQFTEGDECTERSWIFCVVGKRHRRIGAIRIGLARAGERLLYHCAVGGDDFGVDSFDGENVTGFGYDVLIFASGKELLVGGENFLAEFAGGFAIFSVIDESADGNAFGELRNAADVVVVIMSDQDKVDFVDTGVVSGGDDALGVAAVVAGPAGVDEQ